MAFWRLLLIFFLRRDVRRLHKLPCGISLTSKSGGIKAVIRFWSNSQINRLVYWFSESLLLWLTFYALYVMQLCATSKLIICHIVGQTHILMQMRMSRGKESFHMSEKKKNNGDRGDHNNHPRLTRRTRIKNEQVIRAKVVFVLFNLTETC